MQEEIGKLYDKIRELQTKVIELREKLNNQEEDVNTWHTIDGEGTIHTWENCKPDYAERYEEIGNCFRTKEEAKLAIKKLKALKRLRDKGFKFCGSDDQTISYRINTSCWSDKVDEDIALLFDGEE